MRLLLSIIAAAFSLSVSAAPPEPALPYINQDPAFVKSLTDRTNVFVNGLNQLAENYKMALLVEGLPYDPPDNPLSKSINSKASAKDRIAAFANAYDYSVTFSGNMALLRKRYSDIHDLPSVTFEECKGTLDDIVRAFSLAVPKRDRVSAFAEAIIDNLSEEQRQQLSKDGLAFNTLSPEQKTLVDQWAMGVLLDNPGDSARGGQFLLDPKNRSVFFLQAESASASAEQRIYIEYTMPIPEPRPGERALALPVKGMPPRFNTSIEEPFIAAAGAIPPTLKLDNDLATTLGGVADKFNQTRKTAKESRLLVSPDLTAKAMLLVGDAATLSAEEGARNVAFLYGLSLQKETTGDLLLKRPRWNKALTPTDLPLFVQQAIPDPVSRAVNAKSLIKMKEVLMKEREHLFFLGLPSLEFGARIEIVDAKIAKIDSVIALKKTIAGVLLRDIVKKQMDARKTSRLALTEAAPAMKDLLGLMLMLKFVHDSKGRFEEAFGDWLIKHDDFVLSGKVYDDPLDNVQRASLSFSQKQANGRIFTPLSVGGGLYHPERKLSDARSK